VYPDGPIIRGLEASLGYLDSLPWGGSLKVEAERFFDVDDERVVVFVRATATGEGSGVPVEMRDAHEFTIRDGVFVRWRLYADRTEALEAAGLSE
jgi:ketosteroid isomerase-like protein